jgi:hypothetical protein
MGGDLNLKFLLLLHPLQVTFTSPAKSLCHPTRPLEFTRITSAALFMEQASPLTVCASIGSAGDFGVRGEDLEPPHCVSIWVA